MGPHLLRFRPEGLRRALEPLQRHGAGDLGGALRADVYVLCYHSFLGRENVAYDFSLDELKSHIQFLKDRGFKFISYAVWWVRQSIMQAIADQSRVVRLPLNRVGNLTKISKAYRDLEQEYERKPTTDELAQILEMTSEEVFGVVTFYTMYFQKPMGKNHIQVCTNVSCMLRGGYEIWNQVKDKFGIDHLGVTSDQKFSLEEVECMGSCGTAPMIAINEDFYENLSKEKVEEILSTLGSEN